VTEAEGHHPYWKKRRETGRDRETDIDRWRGRETDKDTEIHNKTDRQTEKT
jgi:hypothetical protein